MAASDHQCSARSLAWSPAARACLPHGWERRLSGGGGRLLAASWPALFWVGALTALFLVVGSLVVGAALDLALPDLFVYSLFLVVVTMPLATLAGIADRVRSGSRHDASATASSAAHKR